MKRAAVAIAGVVGGAVVLVLTGLGVRKHAHDRALPGGKPAKKKIWLDPPIVSVRQPADPDESAPEQ